MRLKYTNSLVYSICTKATEEDSEKKRKRSLFAMTRTTQCCVHMILQVWLCLCQVFPGSEQYEKVRHSNRISLYDLFTPRLSLSSTALPSPPFPPGTVGAGWHPRATRPAGRVTAPGPRLTCFNNFLRPLRNYANILVQFP